MRHLIISFFLGLGVVMPSYAIWDPSTPSGSEAKSLGDDRIRELKTDIATSLDHEGDFPGSDTSNPKFIWTPTTGTVTQRNALASGSRPIGKVFINKTSSTVEQWNGTTWDVIANMIPVGTKQLFVQNACPIGWVIDTSSDGYAIRTTTTAASGATTGGTADISTTTFAHMHVVDAHTHSVPNHQHSFETVARTIHNSYIQNEYISTQGAGNPLQVIVNGGGSGTQNVVTTRTQTDGSTTSGSTSPNTSTTAMSILKYMNVIVCTKE